MGRPFARPRVIDQLTRDISLDDPVHVLSDNKDILLGKVYITNLYLLMCFKYRTSRESQVRLQPPYHEDYLWSHPIRV